MTTVELMDNLAEYLRPIVTEYSTEQPTGHREIKVYAGYPPLRLKPDEQSSHIYVLVTDSQDTSDTDMSVASVEIGFSIYEGGEREPWRTLYNLMEHIRQHLLKYRTVANAHRLVMPVKLEIPDAQPVPQWQGRIVTKYTIGQPYEEDINFGY